MFSLFPVTSPEAEVAQLKAGSWQSLELKCGPAERKGRGESWSSWEGALDAEFASKRSCHSTYEEEQLMAHDIFLYTDFIYIHVVFMIND